MAYPRNVYDNNGVSGSEDTVYRYLCPVRKAGSIIGKGGEIAKRIRSETKANMKINEALPGCDERVVTIYSTSEETNHIEDNGDLVCPAFDALCKIHDTVVAEELDNDDYDYDYDDDEHSEKQTVTARMIVPSDQIGCLIGKGGQVIQKMRDETNAQIRIMSDNLPICALALSQDELLQIIGDPSAVREALYQVASLLYDNPSRFQHYFLSSSSSQQQTGGVLMSPPLMSSRKNYSASRDVADAREFSICFICPPENVGGVIGKGGCFINQIRQESGATVKVNTTETDEDDDCIIFISSKEFFEDQSPTVNAALRLQTRCSEKVGKDSTDSAISTRLLVPNSQVGCLIGKGGALISEMRSVTKANIRIYQGEDVPRIAREGEEMVQITGSLDAAIKALTQVMLRLRANVFDMDRGLVLLPTFFPYISQKPETSSKAKHRKRENHAHGSMEIARNEDYGSQMNINTSRRNRVY